MNDGNQEEQDLLNMFELRSLLSPHQDWNCCSPGFKRTSDRHNWLAVSDMFLYVVLVPYYCVDIIDVSSRENGMVTPYDNMFFFFTYVFIIILYSIIYYI